MTEDNITLLKERIQAMLVKVKAFESFFNEVEKDKAVCPQNISREYAICGKEVRVKTSFFPRFDLTTKIMVDIRFQLDVPTISGDPPKRFYQKLRIPA